MAAGAASASASGVAAGSSSSPQPAARRARQAMRTARSRSTAGKDNAPRVSLSPAVRRYDHFLLDLDGCLWLGDEPIEGAADAVTALREAGKSVLFLTNDVRQAPEGFVRKLWRLGFQASLPEVMSAGAAVQFTLAERRSRHRLRGRLAGAGRPRRRGRAADRQQHAVRDPRRRGGRRRPRRSRLRGAEGGDPGRAARRRADRRHARLELPDAGRPVAGHRAPSWRRSRPPPASAPHGSSASPRRRCTPPRATGSAPGRTLAVGDRLDIDIAGARRAGLDSALVLTGGTTRAEADAADPRPTHVADSLAALVLG